MEAKGELAKNKTVVDEAAGGEEAEALEKGLDEAHVVPMREDEVVALVVVVVWWWLWWWLWWWWPNRSSTTHGLLLLI